MTKEEIAKKAYEAYLEYLDIEFNTIEIPEGYEARIEGNKVIIEPKESEDEMIRNEIIDYLNFQKVIISYALRTTKRKKGWLAYLEKQKEQPKEELGKYLEEENLAYRLNWVMQDYIKAGKDDEEKEHRFKCYKLFWDALEDENFFEQKEQKPTPDWMPKFLDELRSKKNYFDWDEHRDLEGQILAIINWIAPNYFNRKEQEQKPAEPAGKLSREEYLHQLLIDQLITYSDYEYLTGKKPAEWSEEDRHNLKSVISLVHNTTDGAWGSCIGDRIETWLKSLPERFNIQPKQEWSEEDKKHKKWILECLADGKRKVPEYADQYQSAFDWLKSLRPSWKPSEQEKGALRTAISILTEERNFPKAAAHLQAILDAFDGKESRKNWKPSEEQMEALSWLVEYVSPSEKYIILIKNLYEQLKKL